MFLDLAMFKDEKDKEASTDVMDLLTSDNFDTQLFEDNTMTLLNELLGNNPEVPAQTTGGLSNTPSEKRNTHCIETKIIE